MVLKLKKANDIELDEINRLVVESEMATTSSKINRDIFIEKYTIEKPHLLTNLSYTLYENDRMVGFFMIISNGKKYELEYFYIEQGRIGKGLGKIMWKHVIDVCNENNISSMSIVCGKYVTGFYLKMGAKKIGELESKVYPGVKIDLLEHHVRPSSLLKNRNSNIDIIQ